MANDYFIFREFTIHQDRHVFRVGTDGVILGASAGVNGVGRILDVGTGTGLIAIMLAQRSNAMITAIEPDHESFLCAGENVARCKWKERITVLNTDIQNFEACDTKFDLIITNPPYFRNSIRNPDSRKSSFRHNDNLSDSDILEAAVKLLDENGTLQLILPEREGRDFIRVAEAYGFFCSSVINIRPKPGAPVRRLVLSFGRSRSGCDVTDLVIEKGLRHDFTDEYRRLTGEFYLEK